MERLQKIIASSGYCSRRKAEELILAGRVQVNGEIIKTLGSKATNNDIIMVDNNIINNAQNKVYYILNKPRGYISTVKDDKNRKTVCDLIDTDLRIYPIGRLDYDTTGLILLTNDGEFANLMMHPKNNISKKYVAKLEGIITGNDINKLKSGIVLDNQKIIPDRIKLRSYDKKTNTSIIEIAIHQGKNHQVKRMLEAIGFQVEKLKREQYGILTLKGLRSKEYRLLTLKEVREMFNIAKN